MLATGRFSWIIISKNFACQQFSQKLWKRLYTSRNILKLHERGLWADRFPFAKNNFTDELNSQTHTIYSGFDPTSDSLHVGNLLVIMALLHSQRAGHNVIALIGGATSRVGDPSGRSRERPLIDIAAIEKNVLEISASLKQIFLNHQEIFWDNKNGEEKLPPLRIANNMDWYKKHTVIDFLSDVGRYFRLGPMLSRSSVQSRLTSEEGMSFTEFSYQILQAYDWLHLYDNYKCTIQIGGNDQMGNIVSGHDLISRVRDKQVTGLTVPLITTESGDKFGKSAGNAIWLQEQKTSPFDFYQFFLRIKDSEAEKYLLLFTFIPVNDIKLIMSKHWEKPESRYAQKKLAEKVTLLVHGTKGLKTAKITTGILYGGRPELLVELTEAELSAVFHSASSCSLLLEPGTSVIDMALKAECFQNKVDAQRIIEAGGFYINLSRVTNPDLVLIPGAHILSNSISLLRVGKKNYYLVKWHY